MSKNIFKVNTPDKYPYGYECEAFTEIVAWYYNSGYKIPFKFENDEKYKKDARKEFFWKFWKACEEDLEYNYTHLRNFKDKIRWQEDICRIPEWGCISHNVVAVIVMNRKELAEIKKGYEFDEYGRVIKDG